MEYDYDLGWGDPYFLLEILSSKYKPNVFKSVDVSKLIYEEDLGNPKLVDYCRQITQKFTGNTYKHVMITNGATQAINSILRGWSENLQIDCVWTSKLGYPFYPRIIQKGGFDHIKTDLETYKLDNTEKALIKHAVIIDSPSNPLGYQIHNFNSELTNGSFPTIWDAVYHNPIYNANMLLVPKHDVYVGSFSKLLGITGARVGWLATNNDDFFNMFLNDSLYENATVSRVSQDLVQNILENINLDQFVELGRINLDNNREILQKISKITGFCVQNKGMFYSFPSDDKLINLFERSKIKIVVIEEDDVKTIRLNIGQTSDILNKSVKSITKADSIGR